jgi:hypothetical protein
VKSSVGAFFALVGLVFTAGCWPWTKTAKVTWDTPSVPVAFRVQAPNGRECRFDWLTFDAEFEYDAALSKERAWDIVGQCGKSIGSPKFVAEAILAPKVAAADATLQLSLCVVGKAKEHVAVNHLQFIVNAGDWGGCL